MYLPNTPKDYCLSWSSLRMRSGSGEGLPFPSGETEGIRPRLETERPIGGGEVPARLEVTAPADGAFGSGPHDGASRPWSSLHDDDLRARRPHEVGDRRVAGRALGEQQHCAAQGLSDGE